MIRGTLKNNIGLSALFTALLLAGCKENPSFTVADSAVQGDESKKDTLDAGGVTVPNAVGDDPASAGTLTCKSSDEGVTVCVDGNGREVADTRDSDNDGIPNHQDTDDDNDGIADVDDPLPLDPSNGDPTNPGGGDPTVENPPGGGTDPVVVVRGQTDSFKQNPDNEKNLDLVVVVDNSGSMAEEQMNLAPKLTKVLEFADTANWRIAVRTTDPNVGGIALLVDKQDQSRTFDEKKQLLQTTIQGFGIAGSGNEQGIPMAVTGLKASSPGTSTPWVRSDSVVAVLIVSDEDNCSNGRDCNPVEKNEAAFLLDYLDKNSLSTNIGRELGKTAKVYGLIRRNAAECTQAASVGVKYMDAITRSGGIAGKICDADYSNTLSAISADLGTVLNLAFTLSEVPIPGSIVIKVNNQPYTSSFIINGKVIQLTDAPPPNSDILISYSYSVP